MLILALVWEFVAFFVEVSRAVQGLVLKVIFHHNNFFSPFNGDFGDQSIE